MSQAPLTDCPAQHGGAKRQQQTDVAACQKLSVRGQLLKSLARLDECSRRDRSDHELDRSQTECRDDTSRLTPAEGQTIREPTDGRFACGSGTAFAAP